MERWFMVAPVPGHCYFTDIGDGYYTCTCKAVHDSENCWSDAIG